MSSLWGDRWRSAIELDLFADAPRLKPGRNLARRAVPEIEIEPGAATGRFSSRRGDVVVTVGFAGAGEATWDEFGQSVAGRPVLAAAVMTGRFPPDLDGPAAEVGLGLRPRSEDLSFVCSCDGWEEPCEHVVAVLYLLSETIDTDPFTILVLLGHSRQGLLGVIGRHRSRAGGVEPAESSDQPRGPDPGTPAGDAFERVLSPLPRAQPLPRRAGAPVDGRQAPPSDSGIAAGDLRALVADAALRATAALQGADSVGLHRSVEADLVRRAASRSPSPRESEELADKAGIDARRLAGKARAWAFGGESGLAVHDQRWDPGTEAMQEAITVLGPRSRRSGNTVVGAGVQLRLDPGGRWWRFEPHDELGWVVASGGFDDPVDALEASDADPGA